MAVYPLRNREVPLAQMPIVKSTVAKVRNVPPHVETIRVDAAARAGRLAERNPSEYLLAESVQLQVSSQASPLRMTADGAVFVLNAANPVPIISPATLSAYDPRAQSIVVLAKYSGLFAKHPWLPVCTPVSPAAMGMFDAIPPLMRPDAGRNLVMLDLEGLDEAVRSDAMSLWTDALRSLQDGVDFISSLVPAGTRARKLEDPRLEAWSASHLLSSTTDRRDYATWVNIATKALRAAKAQFQEYLGA